MDRKELKLFFDGLKGGKENIFGKFLAALRGGKNTVYHNVASEAVTIGDEWVETLEKTLFSVENIVKNPNKFITDEKLLVDVSRAKKTDSETIRHLSANSRYVRGVTENGEIRPRKVLTSASEDDIAIYENRFVCALVHRAVRFAEARHKEITEKYSSYDRTGAGIVTNFRFGESECELKMRLSVKEKPKDKVLIEKNERTVERVNAVRARLKILLNTSFIRELSGEKPVRAPIIKTNLIRMNRDYNNCYKLWLYLSAYSLDFVSVKYLEKNLPVGNDFYDDLTAICAMGFNALLKDGLLSREEYADIPQKPVKEKKFRLITAYKFQPVFSADKKQAGEETVNEYYFKAMRDELIKVTRQKDLVTEKEIRLSFARFCRSVFRINAEMFEDVISTVGEKSRDFREKTALRKKEDEVKRRRQRLKRYRQLSALKKEELERVLKAEARESLKLAKSLAVLNKERGARADAAAYRAAEKQKAAKIMAKKTVAERKAEIYSEAIFAKENERLIAAEEKRRKLGERARVRRDLKRLAELKEKYEKN